MARGKPELRARIRGVVLQRPVNDREYQVLEPKTARLLQHARSLSPEELVPIKAKGMRIPITIKRFLSFTTKDGKDEMFSSDSSVEEREALMGHMASVPTATFLSGADEYVPPGEGRTPEALAENLGSVFMPPGDVPVAPQGSEIPVPSGKESRGGSSLSRIHIIECAPHTLRSDDHVQEFVSGMEAFVRTLSGSGQE